MNRDFTSSPRRLRSMVHPPQPSSSSSTSSHDYHYQQCNDYHLQKEYDRSRSPLYRQHDVEIERDNDINDQRKSIPKYDSNINSISTRASSSYRYSNLNQSASSRSNESIHSTSPESGGNDAYRYTSDAYVPSSEPSNYPARERSSSSTLRPQSDDDSYGNYRPRKKNDIFDHDTSDGKNVRTISDRDTVRRGQKEFRDEPRSHTSSSSGNSERQGTREKYGRHPNIADRRNFSDESDRSSQDDMHLDKNSRNHRKRHVYQESISDHAYLGKNTRLNRSLHPDRDKLPFSNNDCKRSSISSSSSVRDKTSKRFVRGSTQQDNYKRSSGSSSSPVRDNTSKKLVRGSIANDQLSQSDEEPHYRNDYGRESRRARESFNSNEMSYTLRRYERSERLSQKRIVRQNDDDSSSMDDNVRKRTKYDSMRNHSPERVLQRTQGGTPMKRYKRTSTASSVSSMRRTMKRSQPKRRSSYQAKKPAVHIKETDRLSVRYSLRSEREKSDRSPNDDKSSDKTEESKSESSESSSSEKISERTQRAERLRLQRQVALATQAEQRYRKELKKIRAETDEGTKRKIILQETIENENVSASVSEEVIRDIMVHSSSNDDDTAAHSICESGNDVSATVEDSVAMGPPEPSDTCHEGMNMKLDPEMELDLDNGVINNTSGQRHDEHTLDQKITPEDEDTMNAKNEKASPSSQFKTDEVLDSTRECLNASSSTDSATVTIEGSETHQKECATKVIGSSSPPPEQSLTISQEIKSKQKALRTLPHRKIGPQMNRKRKDIKKNHLSDKIGKKEYRRRRSWQLQEEITIFGSSSQKKKINQQKHWRKTDKTRIQIVIQEIVGDSKTDDFEFNRAEEKEVVEGVGPPILVVSESFLKPAAQGLTLDHPDWLQAIMKALHQAQIDKIKLTDLCDQNFLHKDYVSTRTSEIRNHMNIIMNVNVHSRSYLEALHKIHLSMKEGLIPFTSSGIDLTSQAVIRVTKRKMAFESDENIMNLSTLPSAVGRCIGFYEILITLLNREGGTAVMFARPACHHVPMWRYRCALCQSDDEIDTQCALGTCEYMFHKKCLEKHYEQKNNKSGGKKNSPTSTRSQRISRQSSYPTYHQEESTSSNGSYIRNQRSYRSRNNHIDIRVGSGTSSSSSAKPGGSNTDHMPPRQENTGHVICPFHSKDAPEHPAYSELDEVACGFSYINATAIAIRRIQKEYPRLRAAIIDIDVHHGNGNQSVFYTDPTTMVISMHRGALMCERIGSLDFLGKGQGFGFNINLPLQPGDDDDVALLFTHKIILPLLRQFEPHLIVVALGFDALALSPKSGFEKVPGMDVKFSPTVYGDIIGNLCKVCPRVALNSEGGYDVLKVGPAAVGCVSALLGKWQLTTPSQHKRKMNVTKRNKILERVKRIMDRLHFIGWRL